MYGDRNSIYPNPNDRNYYDEYTPGDYDEFVSAMPESYVNEELNAIPFAADDDVYGVESSDETFQHLPYNPSSFSRGQNNSAARRKNK